jgi:two-component system, LuxR family, response regulator FixJ
MVYIVDDDVYVQRGFQLLLKSADFKSMAFDSAEAFLRSFQPAENDVLMLDIHLPDMNGCELLEHLSEKGIRMNVIIITAYDEPSSRESAKKYGALAYLRKPIDGNALIDVLKYSVNKN